MADPADSNWGCTSGSCPVCFGEEEDNIIRREI